MTSVQLRQIDQTFGKKHVLRGLDLDIPSGQYVVLLGPSGCGKTTTLRVIAGLQRPDHGDVLFDGKCVNAVPPRDRNVAMVFQQDGLYPHLTVGESIRFALRGRVSGPEMQARLDTAVELTGTQSILDRYPGRLSGGELRRAAVAKAIARRSSIRLLDEPLSALDIPVRHALQDDLLRWHTTAEGTSIHVTHDGQEAMRMADKIAVMEAGRIAQFAAPSQVYSRPRTVSVAQAIGSPPINLLRASRVNKAVEFCIPQVSGHLEFEGEVKKQKTELLLGIRPESFRVVAPEAAAGWDVPGIVVTGDSIRSQRVGRDLHLHVAVGEETLAAVVPGIDVDESCIGAKKICLVAFRPDVHFFDAESGLRIEQESDV